ncbi:related to PUB1 - major polyadenylated RNA-binding protein of nucleus and cytoplasm [Ustilago sp. UG-2017b]|nr:related to PUB1 - major polyadenylated RNA-binding protein of nucleus and cytoplasm [Ustilago sp. UG-2017b]
MPPIRPLVHVANLPATTTERDLCEMFGSLGQIQSAKVVTSRPVGGLVYGFVEYVDAASAERAIRTMDGWLWFGTPIKVTWAKHSMHPDAATSPAAMGEVDPTEREGPVAMHSNAGHSHLFVGDLSPEVDDASLRALFSRFPSLGDVRVMYDAETGKSRGFGFINFRSRNDAETCIATMQGQWLGGRQIRVNWANQKNQNQPPLTAITTISGDYPTAYPSQSQQRPTPFSTKLVLSSYTSTPSNSITDRPRFPGLPRRHTAGFDSSTQPTNPSLTHKTYSQVLSSAPSPVLTSVYVGNLPPLTSCQDLLRIFAPFNHGQPLEARIPSGRGYGFIKLASHEQAANAVCTLSIQGVFMHSRWLRFGWQKDREPGVRGDMRTQRSESDPAPGFRSRSSPSNPDFIPF